MTLGSNPPLGTLFAIGGAEAKLRRRSVLAAFVAAAGGADARIAVVPSASSLGDEVVEVYRAVFTSLGAREVIAIERDPRCLPALAQIAEAYPDRLTVISGDALETDYRLLAQGPTRIIANLPYNIATPLLTGWLTAANSASPGVGESSGSTMPSITKLPSWTTSPKSPP